jgi:hypothetical protein
VRMLLTVRATMVGVACAVVTLTGCSASVEAEATVSKADLEQGISDALEEATGQAPDSVDCPGSVKAKVDESVRCELTAGSDKYGLTATITSYDNSKAQYDVKVDEEPASTGDPTGSDAPTGTDEASIPKTIVEQGISDALEESVGQRPDSVECPSGLTAKVGETIRCELTAGSDRVGLTATITSYDNTNGNAQYSIKVDDQPIS